MGQRVRWGEEVWSRDGCGSFPAGTFSGSFSCVANVSLPPFFLKDLFVEIKQLRRRGKGKKEGLNNLFFIGTKKCFSFSPRESRVGMNESDLYISSVSDHLSGQSDTTEMTFHLFAWPVTAFHLAVYYKRGSQSSMLFDRELTNYFFLQWQRLWVHIQWI